MYDTYMVVFISIRKRAPTNYDRRRITTRPGLSDEQADKLGQPKPARLSEPCKGILFVAKTRRQSIYFNLKLKVGTK